MFSKLTALQSPASFDRQTVEGNGACAEGS